MLTEISVFRASKLTIIFVNFLSLAYATLRYTTRYCRSRFIAFVESCVRMIDQPIRGNDQTDSCRSEQMFPCNLHLELRARCNNRTPWRAPIKKEKRPCVTQ
ncbi:unnamed protein product [Clavelina lepadiformis]|uniref:Secreted protein n=1 Tax=Clavelina lepadiformis TaxID=159417 RepID=A0ABP0F9D9_CLALP